MSQWRDARPTNGNLWTFVAHMYGALDDVDEVVESATRSVELCLGPEPCAGGSAFLKQLYREPSWFSQRVRNNPRMVELLRRCE